jgi:hypothetical protein
MAKEVKENSQGIISKVFQELLCRELRHGFNRMESFRESKEALC